MQAFQAAFRTLGYEACSDGSLEDGVEKVAIYLKNDKVKHMARQIASGRWTSKLGRGEDIEHATLAELEGKRYGLVTDFMGRKRGRA